MIEFLQQKQHNAAMETGDHSKNGASPKSQTSRESSLFQKVSTILFTTFFTVNYAQAQYYGGYGRGYTW